MKILKSVFIAISAMPFMSLANGADAQGLGMMPWGMMGGYGGFWGIFFMFAYSIIILVIGVLLIIWLWQQINKK